MSTDIFEQGELSGTQCCSRCDVCHLVRLGVQLTGRNGYVMICYECMPNVVAQLPLGPLRREA